MSEEIKIKISQPMFELGELETFDNNIHSIVEEYSKLMFKEKDQILTQRIIIKQEEEIERLKEVINGMIDNEEKYCLEINRLNNIINRTTKYVQSLSSKGRGCDIYEDIKQEILKELKGSDKE